MAKANSAPKVTIAEVKAAVGAKGSVPGINKISQEDRRAIVSGTYSAPLPANLAAKATNASAASANVGGLNQMASPNTPQASVNQGQQRTNAVGATAAAPATPVTGGLSQASAAKYRDAPTNVPAALKDMDLIGQFGKGTKAGNTRYVDASGKVWKVNAAGTKAVEVKPLTFGDPTQGLTFEEGYTPSPHELWADYNIERSRSGKVAKIPSRTFSFYNPVTGQVEEKEEEEEIKEEEPLLPTPPVAPVYTPPTAPGSQYGVTDKLPWLTGPNTTAQSLSLAPSGTGNPTLPSGQSLFNIDWQSDPFSGKNWGNTAQAATGMTVPDIYRGFMDAARSGNWSMDSLSREMGLNPGSIHKLYEQAVQYAAANGLPLPSFPQFSSQTAPYNTYGFGAGKQQVGYNMPGNVDDPATTGVNEATQGQWMVNPLSYWMNQLATPPTAGTTTPAAPPPVAAPQYGATPLPAFAEGGRCCGALNSINDDPVIHRYIRGGSGGQDDDIHALLSPGEYVFDADVVSALGDGNNEAGARKLDRMREAVRSHKRSAPANKIPPKAKAPEQYLRKGK